MFGPQASGFSFNSSTTRLVFGEIASPEVEESIIEPYTAQISPEESLRRLSLFHKQDLAIKVDDTVLHVNKEQLMTESPVFKDLLSSAEYKKENKELDLEGKDLNTVVDFLRCTLSGIDEALTDKTVHDILPLAAEYNTKRSLEKADNFLAEKCKQLGNGISSAQIVKNILQAERYQLVSYLDQCVDIASKKCFDNLVTGPQFEEISKETRLKISLKRWEKMDIILKSTGRFGSATETADFYRPITPPVFRSTQTRNPNADLYKQLAPFMPTN